MSRERHPGLEYCVVLCLKNGTVQSSGGFYCFDTLLQKCMANWTAHMRGWLVIERMVVVRADGVAAFMEKKNVRDTLALLVEAFKPFK